MDNIPDKDIDYIFREGSEKHDFPFKEGAWDNMDALLDKEVKKRHWKRWSLLLLLLISFTGIGVMTYWNTSSKKSTPKPSTDTEYAIGITENESADIATNDTVISNDKENTIDQITSNETTLQNSTSTKKNENLVTQPIKKTNEPKEYLVNNENKNSTHTNTATTTIDYNTTPSSITKLDAQENITTEKSTSTKVEENISTEDILLSNVENERTFFNHESIENQLFNTLSIENTLKGKESPSFNIEEPRKDRFRIGLLVGQEWSSVGMMSGSKKGYKLGVELAYQFGNRFQLSTGITASKKKYETQGTNYQARVARWVDAEVPQTVEGTCDIFEIPLDFTYYFKGYETSSFFINAGLNSYVMRKEWYDYEYVAGTDVEGRELPTFWTGKMKNNHFLSVTNLSIGYQRILNDNMTIQLAPYVQVPLKGIGDGQVKLYTTGLQMKMFFGR